MENIILPSRKKKFRVLTDNQLPIEILDNPPLGWEKVFEESREEITECEKNVIKYPTITPPLTKVFRMYQAMSPRQIRVAIFCDEPDGSEKGFEQMRGFGFSGSPQLPPTYMTSKIHERLFETVEDFEVPQHNSFEKWFTQGVFISSIFLTTGLKTEKHKPLWNGFTLRAIKYISQVNPSVIFLFWGREASEYVKYVRRHPNLLTGSIYSSNPNDKNSFAVMNHFNIVNKILTARGEKEIDWSL